MPALPAARVHARRPSGGTTRCSSAASASWRCWARPGARRWRSGAASWSRSSATRGSASPGWSRRRWRRSRRGSCAAAACPTGRASPTGRSWRCVKQLDALPSDPAAAAAIRSLLGESEAGTSAEEIAWAFRKLLEEQAPLVVVLRRRPVGRGDVPRPGRARRAALPRRADPAALHGPPRAARPPPGLAGGGAARAAEQPRRRPA